MPPSRIVGGSSSQAGWVHLRGNVVMEHGCQVATVLTLLQCRYHFMPSTVPREELLGSDEHQGVARGFYLSVHSSAFCRLLIHHNC